MTQPAPKPCKHYHEDIRRTPQLGGPPLVSRIPMCRLLESLDKYPGDKVKKLQVLDDMMQKGGGSFETTQCQFGGQPPCPYYETP